jgi:hypothetical protein
VPKELRSLPLVVCFRHLPATGVQRVGCTPAGAEPAVPILIQLCAGGGYEFAPLGGANTSAIGAGPRSLCSAGEDANGALRSLSYARCVFFHILDSSMTAVLRC